MKWKAGYGKFLTHHRLANGYKTQKALADVSGVTAATISRIESEIQKPNPETIGQLIPYLKTTTLAEFMVVAGHVTEDDWLQREIPGIDEDDKEYREYNKIFLAKEDQAEYKTPNPSKNEQEAESDILPIEELVNHTLTYKGQELTEEQKRHLAKLIQAAAEMLEK